MISQGSVLLSVMNGILDTVMQLLYANKVVRVVWSVFNFTLKCNKALKFLLNFTKCLSTQQVAITSEGFGLQPPGNY